MSQLGKTNTMPVVSLVFSIMGWTALPLIGSIVAIITGYKARKEIQQSGGVDEGDGLATAGIILGWIPITILLLGFFAFVLLALISMWPTL